MKLLNVTEATLLEEMLNGEGWKIFMSITDDLAKNIEREVLERSVPIEKKKEMFTELYHLKDFVRLPYEAIQLLVRTEQSKEMKTTMFDPYHTIKSLTKDSE